VAPLLWVVATMSEKAIRIFEKWVTLKGMGFSPYVECIKMNLDFSVCVRTYPCANLLTRYRREAALTCCF
jgi:hypothetical protein